MPVPPVVIDDIGRDRRGADRPRHRLGVVAQDFASGDGVPGGGQQLDDRRAAGVGRLGAGVADGEHEHADGRGSVGAVGSGGVHVGIIESRSGVRAVRRIPSRRSPFRRSFTPRVRPLPARGLRVANRGRRAANRGFSSCYTLGFVSGSVPPAQGACEHPLRAHSSVG